MALTFTSWQAQVAVLCGVAGTSPQFTTETPAAIDYAELRILRDLDLINAITTDTSTTTGVNARFVSIPTAFVVINAVNLLTPAGNSNPLTGGRITLDRVSMDVIDFLYPPGVANAAPPVKYAIFSQSQIAVGPVTDAAYTVEYRGTQRPTPLSASNPTTFLSTNLPDLFEAATMIHFSASLKNFGAAADDPRMAVSWETIYKENLAGCDAEELRKRYMGTSILPPAGGAKQPASPGAARQ